MKTMNYGNTYRDIEAQFSRRVFPTKTREGAGKRILVGQAPNKKWAPGGALLHRHIGMAVAIPAIPPAPSLGATNILTR